MADVFQRAASRLKGAFAADQGRLSFGAGLSVALVQNVNASYMQNVARLYEVGNEDKKNNVYYVGGRSQGNMSIARVLGPSSVIGKYYEKFGDVCNAAQNTMQFVFDPLECKGQKATYSMLYCVLTTIGIAVAAQDLIVSESSTLIFSGMTYSEAAAPAAANAAAAAAAQAAGAILR